LLALGQYSDVSLAQARDRHDEARKLIANGLDPVEEKRATREKLRTAAAEQPFEVIARGWLRSSSGGRVSGCLTEPHRL